MKKEKFEKTANYIVLFFSVYAILDILRIYFFLGERGLSFGDYDLNYLSRFFYSFNLPITDIKILIFSNVLIFTKPFFLINSLHFSALPPLAYGVRAGV